jgi:hypothetical protein
MCRVVGGALTAFGFLCGATSLDSCNYPFTYQANVLKGNVLKGNAKGFQMI